mmetsp:Transcript_107181/g.298040  ORF Transcript_107181/g.298040 Transcript_107181/m.298040 type:complete len:322 (+) Transcript_107181:179-1144(+)
MLPTTRRPPTTATVLRGLRPDGGGLLATAPQFVERCTRPPSVKELPPISLCFHSSALLLLLCFFFLQFLFCFLVCLFRPGRWSWFVASCARTSAPAGCPRVCVCAAASRACPARALRPSCATRRHPRPHQSVWTRRPASAPAAVVPRHARQVALAHATRTAAGCETVRSLSFPLTRASPAVPRRRRACYPSLSFGAFAPLLGAPRPDSHLAPCWRRVLHEARRAQRPARDGVIAPDPRVVPGAARRLPAWPPAAPERDSHRIGHSGAAQAGLAASCTPAWAPYSSRTRRFSFSTRSGRPSRSTPFMEATAASAPASSAKVT